MSSTTILSNEWTNVTFDTGLVYVGMSRCPSNGEIDDMWKRIKTFLLDRREGVEGEGGVVLHLVHVDSPRLEPPSPQTLMHIATKFVEDARELEIKCVVVQPKVIDAPVKLAEMVFRGIQPKVPLHVCTADDAAAIVCRFRGGGGEEGKAGKKK